MAEKIHRFLDRFESRISLWFIFGGPALVTAVTAYLATWSDWVNQFGAFAWVIVGLLAGLLVVLIILGGIEIRFRHTRTSAIKLWQAKSDYFNPLDKSFNRMRINFSDIYDPITNEIRGKTFTQCELNGPAVIATRDNLIMTGIIFKNCDIIALRTGTYDVFNAIFLCDAQFIDSRISNATILVDPQALDSFLKIGATPISCYPGMEKDDSTRSPQEGH